MAKIWSSIREEDIQVLEEEIKKPLMMMCKGNSVMVRQVTDHTKLYIRLSSLKFRVNSTFIGDDNKLNRLKEDLDRNTKKWECVEKTFDYEYIRLIIRFAMMIDSMGIYKLTNVITFGVWLMTKPEDTDYYVYRR